MADKCICHLSGYQIKDAVARRDVEELKQTTSGHSTEISALKQNNTLFNSKIDLNSKDIQSLKQSVANTYTKEEVLNLINNTAKYPNAEGVVF